jgi:hypothetical protein
MKTQIITIFTALVLSAGITKTTYADPVKNESYRVLNNVNGINKIVVHGNVKLYISDGATDQVKIYNKDVNAAAIVQNKNGELSITSYKAEKLIVWVTSNDLRSVSAYDNAEVDSFGGLSDIDFSIDLHNNASAQLQMNVYSATVRVTDFAKAKLSGNADEYSLRCSHMENVVADDFKASHTSKMLAVVD